jgi:hypothetical protein
MPRYIDAEKVIECIKDYAQRAIEDGRKTLDSVDDIVAVLKIIYALPAAEIAPTDEYERLAKELERVEALYYQKDAQVTNVAREIFEEIEKHILENCCVTDDDVDGIWKHIAKLKKKYTEARNAW